MNDASNIYLIGYRCTGKTTIGRALSEYFHRPFADTDLLIQHQINAGITEFVHSKGWDPFREIESQILNAVSKTPGQVVSTGGGIILNSENRKCLMKTGINIWLQADISVIAARIQNDLKSAETRPSLTGNPIEDEVRQVMADRLPFYEEVADLTVDTSCLSLKQIVNLIKEELSHVRK
ncbi:MAG: shikimate kinase AroL [Desulfobacteraceae bacterium]|nr:MAG: shikimate kinase AroL [Desulfobacteraceae bacterium]